MIIPRSNFSCNGRVTGYLISLKSDSRAGHAQYPSVRVWHPTSSTEYTRVHAECALTASSDISIMTDIRGEEYHLGTVSCSGNNRIEFQSGDVIGYLQGVPARYVVWSVNTNGYISYYANLNKQPPESINADISNLDSVNSNQPLIQVIYAW